MRMRAAQQGSMQSRALARGMVEFFAVWSGIYGCSTSLPYWAPRSQSLGRSCAVVCTKQLPCADAVAKRARDGGRRKSLLHGCYTVDSTWVQVAVAISDRRDPVRHNASVSREDHWPLSLPLLVVFCQIGRAHV